MIIAPPPQLELSRSSRAIIYGLIVVGALAAIVGALLEPQRMWMCWLIASYYAVGVALGALCLVAIHHVTGSSWSVVIRRVQEALAGTLPFVSIALFAAFIGRPHLYEWTSAGFWADADSTLAFKRAWLDWPLFLGRAMACLALWNLFGWAIRRGSRRQDHDGDQGWSRSNARWSAAFLVVLGMTHTMASFDWIMSLEPDWYSSIFAVYNFAGVLVSAVAASIVTALWLERRGPLQSLLTDDHLHDLGKLLFACSTFWMYVWFSQYMLIWYANIPEETAYFVRRTTSGWRPLFFLNLAATGVAPFFVFLRRDAKRSRALLSRVSLVVLGGRWIDLYVMIGPAHLETPRIGLTELGLAAGAIGGVGLLLVHLLRGAPVVPIRDPHLFESLHYEQ
ncbi:MAG: hypothetical protein HY654_11190 [Acidobacteria bacterium]|nr:hypothetical protein [Acidobacteriota bacterium]